MIHFLDGNLKGLPEKSITTPAKSDNSFAPKLAYIRNLKIIVKFNKKYLKQDKASF